MSTVRDVSVKVASAVALAAKKEGAARANISDDEEEREEALREAMWEPVCAREA